MYIKISFANIKIVALIIVCVVFTLLIFPIYLTINLNFDYELKQLNFKAKIFGVKVLTGFVVTNKRSFSVIFWGKKRKEIPYENLLNVKEKVKPLIDYHVIKADILTQIGNGDGIIYPLCVGFISSFISNILGYVLDKKKPYVRLKNNTEIYEDEYLFRVNCTLGIVFNLLMILLSLIKILTEKIINGLRKQNKFGYRNSN